LSRFATAFLAVATVLVLAAVGWYLDRHSFFAAPTPIEVVVDDSGELSRLQRDAIVAYHGALARDHDIDYRVVIAPGAVDVASSAGTPAPEPGFGRDVATGAGIVLVVDPDRGIASLEVPSRLDRVFTAAFVDWVERQLMPSFLAAGRVADGIVATSQRIAERAAQAGHNQPFVPPPVTAPRAVDGMPAVADPMPVGTPAELLDAYRAVLAAHDPRADLSLYTSASQALLARWQLSPARLDAERARLAACPTPVFRVAGTRAVARFASAGQSCPPYFLRVESGRWRLDVVAAEALLRFDDTGQWRIADPGTRSTSDWAFAFDGWKLPATGGAGAGDRPGS